MNFEALLILAWTLVLNFASGHPEKGKWSFEVSNPFPQSVIVTKSMYANGRIDVKIACSSEGPVLVSWYLHKTPCWKAHYENLKPVKDKAVNIKEQLEAYHLTINETFQSVISGTDNFHCVEKETHLVYHETKSKNDGAISALNDNTEATTVASKKETPETPNNFLYAVPADGIYIFVLEVVPGSDELANASILIKIDMKSSYGYLSAADYPLLPFYGIMCFVYFMYGVGWLSVSFLRWRELLRVQYWIGAVILLGMLEKAVFTGVYESINERGDYITSLLYIAEIVSCIKRTLSRILVIIVAFGFGIVKPRLGNVLQRVVILGLLYFVMATVESCLRVTKLGNFRTAVSGKEMFAAVPLALLETVICWWVFSALISTIRTLSLRRNTVKLQLYRHFKNTLAFAVVASVIFMTYCIVNQNLNNCIRDWKQLWVDTAFWHVLFAFILLVIMVLWRPTNNNQRFAFSPLLDEGSEDEEENLVAADVSDTTKLRSTRLNSTSNSKDSRDLEEDLQWLDENIPKTMTDKGFPSVDSDEEIIVTKFEISKMQ